MAKRKKKPKIVEIPMELIDRRPMIEDNNVGGHEFLNWTNGAIRVRAFDNDPHGSLVDLRCDTVVYKPNEQPNKYGNFRRNIFAMPVNQWIQGNPPEFFIPFALTRSGVRVFPWKIERNIESMEGVAWRVTSCSGYDRQDKKYTAKWVLVIPDERHQLCLSSKEIEDVWNKEFSADVKQESELYLEVNTCWELGYKDPLKSYYWTPEFWPGLGERLEHGVAIPHVFVGGVWPGNDLLPTPIAYDIFSCTLYSYRKCELGEPRHIWWADDELGGMTISEAVKHIRGKLP
jgi:hypothetical protein